MINKCFIQNIKKRNKPTEKKEQIENKTYNTVLYLA